jgi:glycosyltransferase involved in cell wall biosynthesis
MKTTSKVHKIAFVGDHLPRKCGIATFTSDLLAAVASAYPQSQCFAVSVNDIPGGYDYPEVVRFEIEEQDLSSYLRAADFLNIGNVDIVCLQHEFGIFGGPAGGHILALLRELRMPVVTTLHTILRDPKADQRRVVEGLISLSSRLVVMAERGRRMLQEIYQAPAAKIDLIPHGIPDVGFVDPTYFKDQFGVEGRVVLLTFGLLSPNKGIENVLNALPQILAEFPEVVYIVLGATHPNELREHGEAYRLGLEILARKNKVDKNVIFYNQFVDIENLKEFIGAADLYITPYLNEAQITSGLCVWRRQSSGFHALLARRGIAGGRPRCPGAVWRRAGHRTRSGRVAARRQPPPFHAQERLPDRPRDDLEQRGADVYAFLRGFPAGSDGAAANVAGHQDARPEAAGTAGD